mgnify:FL=1
MKIITIDPVKVASLLAHEKLIIDLVSESDKTAFTKESELFKEPGEYKDWVEVMFIEEYDTYSNMLTHNHID